MLVIAREAMTIHSTLLARMLTDANQRAYACEGCGSRMFVPSASGLCPVCAMRERAREANPKRLTASATRPEARSRAVEVSGMGTEMGIPSL